MWHNSADPTQQHDLYPQLAIAAFILLALGWLLDLDLWLLSGTMAVEQAQQLHLVNGWLLFLLCISLLGWLLWQRLYHAQRADLASQHFHTTFSQSAVGMAHVSLTGHFILLNQRFADMLQYQPEELAGCSFHDITHPDDLADDLTQLSALNRGAIEHYELEKRYRRSDGVYFWANLSVSMHRAAKAEQSYYVAVIEDIDAKKQAMLALQSSMAQVQLLLDATGDAIIGINRSADITFVNQAALLQLGYQHTEPLLGMPMLTVIAKHKAALTVWRDITTLLEKPQNQSGEADLLLSTSGEVIPCAYRAIPVPASGDGTVLVLCFQNIREKRKQLSKQHAQSHLLHRLLENVPVSQLLTELVNFVEQQQPGLRCSILLADLQHQCLRVAAGPSLPAEYNARVDGLPIRYGNGSCGTAAATGQPVIVTDVANDLLWQQFRELTAPYDWLGGCWSTPFFNSQKTLLGTFAIYVAEQRAPNPEEQDLIQFTVSLAAFLIERSDAKAMLDLLSKAVEQSPVAVVICDPDGIVSYLNQKFEPLTGVPDAKMLGAALPTMYPLELQDEIREAMAEIKAGQQLVRGQCQLQRPDGSSYWQAYSLRRILDSTAKLSHILLEIEDISRQKQAEQHWQDSELRFRTLLDNTPEIAVQGYEADGTTFYWNKASERIYGYNKDEAIGQNLLQLIIPPAMHHDVRQAMQQMAATGEPIPSSELLLQHKNGSLVPVYSGHAVVKLRDQAAQIFCMDLDLTERKQQDEKLRLSAAVFNSSREGILITDTHKRIISVNPALQLLFGYNEAELIGQTPNIFRSGRHPAEFYQQMWQMLQQQNYWQGEILNKRKDGELLQLQLSISAVFDEQQQISHYAAIFTDLSQIRATEAEMAFLADHDELTHLPNRHLFLQLLEQHIKTARAEQQSCAVLVLDLDHFKHVNDSYGHRLGDELLLQVARRLKQHCRPADLLARLGGDEFALLLPQLTAPEEAAWMAEQIIQTMNQPWLLDGQFEVTLGTSIGICLFPAHADNTAALIQGADSALYKAKAAGRSTFTFYADEFTQAARDRLTMEANLRKAIRLGHLQVYYQPQLDIRTGHIIGAEALVRWFDPQQGMIPPSRFIPVAESCGLINEIGSFVLKQSCAQGQSWRQQGLNNLTLAVNVSPSQFKRFDMKALVRETLNSTGFPADALELELTESALMENEEAVIDTLNQLRGLGIRLAIDDFGTGYSSLAYLKRFPLDVLKIDKKFIDDIPASKDDMAIATAIIGIAHTLGFKVLAEGVETTTQLEFLRQQHCDHYQGYLCSPPISAEKFELLLRQQMPQSNNSNNYVSS
ncbi:PAS domain S-box protein [Rheinheimera sp.]|uniref:bifunctional diguanylate cyclase/phosphodiesterase n=1 Tax=Rheinheimera sp. TaxID=1869214 RepID=UPI0027B9002D|nr:PAS domain S-box protein [Rheinheimera sp.]